MFHDQYHPDIPQSDWDAFQRWGSPYVKVLDRNSVNLPDWFVPLARGVATPSRYLLRLAGYGRGWRRPPGWRKGPRGELTKEFNQECLIVTPGPLCRIEREGTLQRPHLRVNMTLAHEFGPTPILAGSVQVAICLAEFCILPGRLPLKLCWAEACPDDVKGAIEYAHQRRINEARSAAAFQLAPALLPAHSKQFN